MFTPHPYSAAVILGPHQQCRFNFGQQQFKYHPVKIKELTNFYTEFERQTKRFKPSINLKHASLNNVIVNPDGNIIGKIKMISINNGAKI